MNHHSFSSTPRLLGSSLCLIAAALLPGTVQAQTTAIGGAGGGGQGLGARASSDLRTPVLVEAPINPSLEGLVNDSPFIPKDDPNAAVGPTAPVEFRGVIEINKDTYLGFYDRASHNTYWMRADGSDNTPSDRTALAVMSYDDDNDKATIRMNNRTYTDVPLATARISLVQSQNTNNNRGANGGNNNANQLLTALANALGPGGGRGAAGGGGGGGGGAAGAGARGGAGGGAGGGGAGAMGAMGGGRRGAAGAAGAAGGGAGGAGGAGGGAAGGGAAGGGRGGGGGGGRG